MRIDEQAQVVTHGLYATGTVLLAAQLSLQTIRNGGDGMLTPEDRRRLNEMAAQVGMLAGELHSRGFRLAKDHGVEYPPESEGGE